MATRQSMDECLQQCNDVLSFAQEQYVAGSKQEHYDDDEYQKAMEMVEEAFNDVAQLAHSANSQQREQLHRMRLQLQQLQNKMILLDH